LPSAWPRRKWQRDLSISHEKIGDVLRDQGNLTSALVEFRAAFAIYQRLAEKDPDNAVWQRDILVSYLNIGFVAYRRNEFSAALDAYERAEKIAMHVKEINPTAASSTNDLAWVQARIEETRRKITGSAAAGNRKK